MSPFTEPVVTRCQGLQKHHTWFQKQVDKCVEDKSSEGHETLSYPSAEEAPEARNGQRWPSPLLAMARARTPD